MGRVERRLSQEERLKGHPELYISQCPESIMTAQEKELGAAVCQEDGCRQRQLLLEDL